MNANNKINSALDKTNVERFEKLNRVEITLIKLLRRTGLSHNEAKLYANNYKYPHVADDIYAKIKHLWKESSSDSRRK